MPHGNRGRKYSERLQYQLHYEISREMFPTRERAEAAQKKAVKHFLKTGKSIPGVHIVARWRNPDNKKPKHANWKTTEDRGHSLMDFWQTLYKDRGALRKLAARYL